jgi:hypothetical protein
MGTVIGICYLVIRYFFPNFKNNNLWLKITFPYLKEEIRIILYTWNESFFGNICSNIIDHVFKSKTFLRLFVLIHIIFSYGIRLVQTLLFCNFVFFHGDLRWNLYLLLLSFISWVLRFFEYYLRTFFLGSCEYLKLLLNVTLKDSSLYRSKDNKGFVLITEDDVNITLTPYALEQGFSAYDLSDLFIKWSLRAHLTVLLKAYDEKLYWCNIFTLVLRLIAWLYIVVFYFFNCLVSFKILTVPMLVQALRRNFIPRMVTRSPTEAFGVKPGNQTALQRASGGAYAKGHYAAVDKSITDGQGNVLFEAGLTHGSGSPQNPSQKIHSTQDLQGSHPKGQSATFAKPSVFVPKKWFNKAPVPNSKGFFEDSETKVNHDHKEEEYP